MSGYSLMWWGTSKCELGMITQKYLAHAKDEWFIDSILNEVIHCKISSWNVTQEGVVWLDSSYISLFGYDILRGV